MGIVQKYTCGQTLPSNQLVFTGTFASFIEDQDNRDFNLFIKNIGDQITSILSDSNFNKIDSDCLDLDEEDISSKDLHQAEIDKLCDHETRISSAEGWDDFEIGDKYLKIDLDCIAPDYDECDGQPSLYTVKAIIEAMVAELCELRDQVNDVCNPESGTSGTSGTVGSAGSSGISGTSGDNGSGTSGISGTTGSSGTCGVCGEGYTCRNYTVINNNPFDGATVFWVDCGSGIPLSSFFTNQISICSREVPTFDYGGSAQIIDNYDCT